MKKKKKKIEKHYGFPVDIEWAFESGKFYIVQSRPITTLKSQEQEKNTSNHVSTSYGNWNLVITRNMSFWHQYLSSSGHYFNTKDFGVNAKNEQLSITVNGTETHIFVRSENMQVYAKAVMEAVDSYEKIEKLKNKYEEFAKELVDSLERCDKNLTLENWEKFIFQYTRFTAGLFLTSVIGRAGVTELTQELKDKGYKEGNITEIVGIITYPEEHTPLFNSQFDLLQIAKEIQDKKLKEKDKKDRLQEWLGNYGYIPVNFNEEPWSIEDANNQLNDFLEKNAEEEINRLTNNHSKKASEAKTKLKEINNEEISTLAKALAEGTYLNEFRKNIFSRVSLGFRSIFAKIAKIGGSDNWRDCFYLTPKEMSQLIEGETISIKDLIKERENIGIRATEEGNIFLNDEDLEKFKQYIEVLHGKAESSKSLEAVETIKGFTASKGNVKGIVKVILSSKDFHKLEAGDILVTTMTSVDFVPIMEKAAAFITNEGGITSHAAIVSRELDKPCIIGTQNATQILKDGDLVEVDADNGVVRILEKEEVKKYILGNQDVDISFLTIEMTWRGIELPDIKKQVGRNTPKSFVEIIKGTTMNYYVPKDELKPFSDTCAEALLKDKKLREYLDDNTVKTAKAIRDFSEKYIDKVDTFTEKEMSGALLELAELQKECVIYGAVVAYADMFGQISNKVMNIINKRESLSHPKHIYSNILASPEEKSLTEKAGEDIRTSGKSNDELTEEYFWLEQGYIGRGLDKKLLKEIKQKEREETNAPRKELFQELRLSEEEQDVFIVSQLLIKLKSLRADSRQFGHVLTNKIVDKISGEQKIEDKYLEVMSAEEVGAYLIKGTLPEKLHERWEHSVTESSQTSEYEFLTGDEANSYLDNHIHLKDLQANLHHRES